MKLREQEEAVRRAQNFSEVADEVLKLKTAGLRNDKSVARWKRALESYAAPLRSMSIGEITSDDVIAALQKPPEDDPKGKGVWERAPESARLARSYIAAVFDTAIARDLRSDNPARWRENLKERLPAHRKTKPRHHAAMPFEAVPSFVGELRLRRNLVWGRARVPDPKRGAYWEVLGAVPSEFDLKAKVWTIPAERMKAGEVHRVPLCERSIEILTPLLKDCKCGFVFQGAGKGKPLSNMAMAMLMRRMKRGDFTPHGFRSAFRDWAGELTHFPREIAEAALAHAVGNATELAYRRGDALEKRRKLMDDWAAYCARR